jgi:hypothetical protein
MHKRTEALRMLKELLGQARHAGLQETAWETELLIAELDLTARAKMRGQQIRREAAALGILRIAQFEPPSLT